MQKYVLKLVVKKKWFDMIVSGEKTEEYREIKPYWIDKLVNQDADSGFIGYANEEKKQPKVFGEIEYTHSLTFSSFMATRRIARASKKRLTASPSVSHKRVCAQTNG